MVLYYVLILGVELVVEFITWNVELLKKGSIWYNKKTNCNSKFAICNYKNNWYSMYNKQYKYKDMYNVYQQYIKSYYQWLK